MFFCAICCKVVDELTYKLIKYNNMDINCCANCYKTTHNPIHNQPNNKPNNKPNNPEK